MRTLFIYIIKFLKYPPFPSVSLTIFTFFIVPLLPFSFPFCVCQVNSSCSLSHQQRPGDLNLEARDNDFSLHDQKAAVMIPEPLATAMR